MENLCLTDKLIDIFPHVSVVKLLACRNCGAMGKLKEILHKYRGKDLNSIQNPLCQKPRSGKLCGIADP